MKKYYLIGGAVTFIVIFNLGYVFHEIIMGNFFKEYIGAIQRDGYIIPLIAFHGLYSPDNYTPALWKNIISNMAPNTNMTLPEIQLVTKYVSKDN